MKNNRRSFLPLLTVAFFLSSCATILNASSIEEELPIYSENTNNESVLRPLKALETLPGYKKAMLKIRKEVSNCATWIVSRTTPSPSSAQPVIFLCSSNADDLWRVGSVGIQDSIQNGREIRQPLGDIIKKIMEAGMVTESQYILTDSTVTFLTMKSNGKIYRRAIVCSNCITSDSSMNFSPEFKKISSVASDIDNLIGR